MKKNAKAPAENPEDDVYITRSFVNKTKNEISIRKIEEMIAVIAKEVYEFEISKEMSKFLERPRVFRIWGSCVGKMMSKKIYSITITSDFMPTATVKYEYFQISLSLTRQHLELAEVVMKHLSYLVKEFDFEEIEL